MAAVKLLQVRPTETVPTFVNPALVARVSPAPGGNSIVYFAGSNGDADDDDSVILVVGGPLSVASQLWGT